MTRTTILRDATIAACCGLIIWLGCEPPAANCSSNETECNGVCTDLDDDVDNCGACGNECDSGEACSQGECVAECAGADTDCGGTCVNLDTDIDNCGACDNPCDAGLDCVDGACVDNVAPSVTITSSDLDLVFGETAILTFTLSEGSSDFDAADVIVTTGTLSEFTVVSATLYTATFTPNFTSTTGTVDVPAGGFTDAGGNANGAAVQLVLTIEQG